MLLALDRPVAAVALAAVGGAVGDELDVDDVPGPGKVPPHLEGGRLEVDVGDGELVEVVEDVVASSGGVGVGAHGGFEMRKTWPPVVGGSSLFDFFWQTRKTSEGI